MIFDSGYFRKLSNIVEGRLPDYEYNDEAKSVTVFLRSHKSSVYTKLGQKFERINSLKEEIDKLENETRNDVRENITDLFDASDAVKTRIVSTVSFVFSLSKDPVASTSFKYADIIRELEEHLTPELIEVLNGIKEKYKTVSKPKAPGIRVSKVEEGSISNIYSKLKNLILNWCLKYDNELDKLKRKADLIK